MKPKTKPKKCVFCEKIISPKNKSGMCDNCSAKTSNNKNKLKTFKQRLERAREIWE